MSQRQLESADVQEEARHTEEPVVDQEEAVKSKMEELRKYSHREVTDAKLRQGALLALGLK
jgi:hypothetical protein